MEARIMSNTVLKKQREKSRKLSANCNNKLDTPW